MSSASLSSQFRWIIMPRRSSGGMRSSSRSSSPRRQAPAAAAPRRQAPAAAAPRPAAAQPQASSGGMMSGLGGMVMTGMAFGAGSAVAHQVVGGLMGSGNSHQDAPAQSAPAQTAEPQQDPCYYQNQDFMTCLQRSSNDVAGCQSYLDVFNSCRSQNKQ
jgi:hypothetical protein